MAHKHPTAVPSPHTPAVDVDAIRDDVASGGPAELVEERLGYARELAGFLAERGITSVAKNGVPITVKQLLTTTGADRWECQEAFGAVLRVTTGLPPCFNKFVGWEIGGRRTRTYSPRKSLASLRDDVRGPGQTHKRDWIMEVIESRDDLIALFSAWFYPTIASRGVLKCKDEWGQFWVVVIDLYYELFRLYKVKGLAEINRLMDYSFNKVFGTPDPKYNYVDILGESLVNDRKLDVENVGFALQLLAKWAHILEEAANEEDDDGETDGAATTKILTDSALCPSDTPEKQGSEGGMGKRLAREMGRAASPEGELPNVEQLKQQIARLPESQQRDISAYIENLLYKQNIDSPTAEKNIVLRDARALASVITPDRHPSHISELNRIISNAQLNPPAEANNFCEAINTVLRVANICFEIKRDGKSLKLFSKQLVVDHGSLSFDCTSGTNRSFKKYSYEIVPYVRPNATKQECDTAFRRQIVA